MARGVGFDRGLPRAPGTASVWPTGQVSQQQVPHSQVWLAFGGGGRGGLLSQTGSPAADPGKKARVIARSCCEEGVGDGWEGRLKLPGTRAAPDPRQESSGSWNPRQRRGTVWLPVHTAGPSRETEDGLTCLFDRQSDREIVHHWFTAPMPTRARAGPGESQEPGLHPGLTCGCRGPSTWTLVCSLPGLLAGR